MSDPMTCLTKLAGEWNGPGLNHESQPYAGHLTLKPINPAAIILVFTATGADGEIFHTETILIGPETATSASNNLPGLAQFTVTHPDAETIILTLGDLTDQSVFRETITLRLTETANINQTYAWALPGQAIQPRSTTTLTRSN